MKFRSTEANISYIKINSLGQHCKFSVGQTAATGIHQTNKKTEGFGEQNADCVRVHIPISFVDDRDIFDCINRKRSHH
ncbi:hypothetical protein WD019_11080 [Fictibacillus sp. Mic-4]|uniref:hypothetical protein n=1 Tax=Fictibacillus sp. Mic-4 TaxID=3132826 RepID=UPI003CF4175B